MDSKSWGFPWQRFFAAASPCGTVSSSAPRGDARSCSRTLSRHRLLETTRVRDLACERRKRSRAASLHRERVRAPVRAACQRTARRMSSSSMRSEAFCTMKRRRACPVPTRMCRVCGATRQSSDTHSDSSTVVSRGARKALRTHEASVRATAGSVARSRGGLAGGRGGGESRTKNGSSTHQVPERA